MRVTSASCLWPSLFVACSLLVACRRSEPAEPGPSAEGGSAADGEASAADAGRAAVAEALPRCRREGDALALPGDDVVVGDVAVLPDALLVGVVRGEGGKRVASVARLARDLASVRMVDVGPALGDAPPPSPRVGPGGEALVAWYASPGRAPLHVAGDAPAARMPARELRLARLDAVGTALVTVAQQGDESLAFDVAWPEGDAAKASLPLVAWDEDAPRRPGALLTERGVVKVQLGGGPPRVVSPEGSDAEEPRLAPRRGGGYWLAWLARRAEADDAGVAVEGPGERRAFRWVELVALDARGEPQGAPRALTSVRRRIASFALVGPAPKGQGGAEVSVLLDDEEAFAEGAGGRLVVVTYDGDRAAHGEIASKGVARATGELLATDADAPRRWLAWSDARERALLVPTSPALSALSAPSREPALAGARLLAALDVTDGTSTLVAAATPAIPAALELRRFSCVSVPSVR